MKQLKKLLLLLVTLLIFSKGYCDSIPTHTLKTGKNLNYKNEIFDTFHKGGNVTMEGVNVHGYAEVDGILYAKDSVFKDLTVPGHLDLKNCTVYNQVHVSGPTFNGSFVAFESILGNLNIRGSAHLMNSYVQGNVDLFGAKFIGDKTNFQKNLALWANHIILKGCTIHSSINIKALSHVIIEIKEGTLIQGSINIEPGMGELYVSSDSQIFGEVTGATIKRL